MARKATTVGHGKVVDLTHKLREKPPLQRVSHPDEINETFEPISEERTRSIITSRPGLPTIGYGRVGNTTKAETNGGKTTTDEAKRLYDQATNQGLAKGAIVVRRVSNTRGTHFAYSEPANWGIVTGHYAYPGPGDFHPLTVLWAATGKKEDMFPDDLWCIRPGLGFGSFGDISSFIEEQIKGNFHKVKYNGL